MTENTTQNTTTEQPVQPAQQAVQSASPQTPETLDLPAMLQNTDALEALMKKAAGQLN
jgi:hypothetical protein